LRQVPHELPTLPVFVSGRAPRSQGIIAGNRQSKLSSISHFPLFIFHLLLSFVVQIRVISWIVLHFSARQTIHEITRNKSPISVKMKDAK